MTVREVSSPSRIARARSVPERSMISIERTIMRRPRASAICRRRSVLARRALEVEPLHLGDRASRQAQRGLEALLAQLAGGQPAAQVAERRPVLIAQLDACGLEQHDVA